MEEYWKKAILDSIPHGEEGSLQLSEEDANTLCHILIKNGYAVCLTGGDIGGEIRVSWIYAGGTDNLDWADYDQVVFTSVDYLDDYPQALQEDYEREEEEA